MEKSAISPPNDPPRAPVVAEPQPLAAVPISYETTEYRLPRHLIYILAISAIIYGGLFLLQPLVGIIYFRHNGGHIYFHDIFSLAAVEYLAYLAAQAMMVVGGILLIQHRRRAVLCLFIGAAGVVAWQIITFYLPSYASAYRRGSLVADIYAFIDAAINSIYPATLLVLLCSPHFRRMLTGPRWHK